MIDQDLISLRARCVTAISFKRKLANVESYVTELEKEMGVAETQNPSAAHLKSLIDKVLQFRAAGGKPKKSKKKSKAKEEAVVEVSVAAVEVPVEPVAPQVEEFLVAEAPVEEVAPSSDTAVEATVDESTEASTVLN